ncbi:hypothetical protein XENTR_v10019397 [Xenopus tropicalis]|nr:hypothetical protein XENTR_v10019397 [Xenopus tropicalis]
MVHEQSATPECSTQTCIHCPGGKRKVLIQGRKVDSALNSKKVPLPAEGNRTTPPGTTFCNTWTLLSTTAIKICSSRYRGGEHNTNTGKAATTTELKG